MYVCERQCMYLKDRVDVFEKESVCKKIVCMCESVCDSIICVCKREYMCENESV